MAKRPLPGLRGRPIGPAVTAAFATRQPSAPGFGSAAASGAVLNDCKAK